MLVFVIRWSNSATNPNRFLVTTPRHRYVSWIALTVDEQRQRWRQSVSTARHRPNVMARLLLLQDAVTMATSHLAASLGATGIWANYSSMVHVDWLRTPTFPLTQISGGCGHATAGAVLLLGSGYWRWLPNWQFQREHGWQFFGRICPNTHEQLDGHK